MRPVPYVCVCVCVCARARTSVPADLGRRASRPSTFAECTFPESKLRLPGRPVRTAGPTSGDGGSKGLYPRTDAQASSSPPPRPARQVPLLEAALRLLPGHADVVLPWAARTVRVGNTQKVAPASSPRRRPPARGRSHGRARRPAAQCAPRSIRVVGGAARPGGIARRAAGTQP